MAHEIAQLDAIEMLHFRKISQPNLEISNPHLDVEKPICVDLDGTLVNTDLLIEGLLAILSSPSALMRLPRGLVAGRAAFKRRVALLSDLEPELLPYNSELIAYLREQKRIGRRIVLVTAADEHLAQAIGKHLGLFDDVISSDGIRNLKGQAKADELVERFGTRGFDYVGNEWADLAVWRQANRIVIVNASRAVTREARKIGSVAAEISNRPPVLWAALRAMRPHQWVKNLLVFVPLISSRALHDVSGLIGAFCVLLSFCATASGIYPLNDLVDLSADRRHARKRVRPFASGALSPSFGLMLACVLIATGLGLAFSVGTMVLLLVYAFASLAYSFGLKHYPLVDVFILAGLYTLRVVAGGVATKHPASLWLLGFSGFTFLSLALVKRSAELIDLARSGENGKVMRRGYFPEDRAILQTFGCASAFASSVVLALFVGSPAAIQQYSAPEVLWGLVPLVLFWECRLWLATARGHMRDDPIVYAAHDWVTWVVIGGMLAVMLLGSSRLGAMVIQSGN